MPSSLFGHRISAPVQAPPIDNQQTGSKFQPPANIGQIKGLMHMMQSGGNSQALLQTLVSSNPMMGPIMNLVQQYRGDARTAFYDLAKQKGVNPNDVINLLK